jgi:hypothetical protein
MLRRGFKAEAERLAASKRADLGIKPFERLPARDLLAHLGAKVIDPSAVPGLDEGDLNQLLSVDVTAWSALTLTSNPVVVIFNSSHSRERQESNLHHEAAHILCGHAPDLITSIAELSLRTFESDCEEEASWLAGCLHLPRVAIETCIRSGMGSAEIGEAYVASQQLLRYRRSGTGIDRQYKH